ncbi:hypothetical protein [Blastococcus litoris]|uniref:hypothetical protein n=1 Tax=Blastococcus litoris TaxID=2171622 RepID=UPI0013E0C626|nr:hypothetical protein [Blastococcus litoris]
MWRRVWSSSLVAVAVGGIVLALPPSAGAAPGGTPAACRTFDESTLLPGRTGPQARLISMARPLAEDGQLDAAERLFEIARTSRPADPEAGVGLAYVQLRRLAAEEAVAAGQELADDGAEQAEVDACFEEARRLDGDDEAAAAGPAEGTTPAAAASSRWDDFYESWVVPAGEVAVPALAVLAVLLAIGRLLSPVAAPSGATAWGNRYRRAAWWLGLTLVATSALVVALRPPTGSAVRDLGVLPVLWGALVAGCVVALWCARDAPWVDPRRRGAVAASAGRGGTMTIPPVPERDATVQALDAEPAPASDAASGRGPARSGVPGWWGGLRDPDRYLPLVLGTGVLAGLLVALASAYWADRNTSTDAAAWVTTVLLALLGVVLLAVGWGHLLRLRIQVKKGNDADASSTAFVLGSLQELGSSPPRGLKVPHETDVTQLPESALSALPQGKVAAAVMTAVAALARPTPWHLSVEDAGDSRMVATLLRHGTVTDTAVLDAGRFRRGRAAAPDDAAAPSPDRAALLTAAAAFALTQLGLRHPELNAGLCGVSRWESVAAQVVATRPVSPPRSLEYRRELLAYAVQTDPRNVLARTAYVQALGEDATDLAAMDADARRLTDLRAVVETQMAGESERHEQGYLPVRLRIAHSLTAARLNLAVEQRGSGEARWEGSWAESVAECRRLTALLDAPDVDDAVRPFLDELVPVTASLIGGLAALASPDGSMGDLLAWADRHPAPPVTSLFAAYDDACTRALARDDEAALRRLEFPAGSSDLRQLMRTDPAFARLREDVATAAARAVRDRFWVLAGEPDVGFVDLPPFGAKSAALRDLGLGSAADVLRATPDDGAELATALEIPKPVAAAWRAFALLACPHGGRLRWLDDRELRLLAECGVRSRQELARRLAAPGPGTPLRTELVAVARKLGARVPTPAELQEVLSLPAV